jgi:hypothetical protein
MSSAVVLSAFSQDNDIYSIYYSTSEFLLDFLQVIYHSKSSSLFLHC